MRREALQPDCFAHSDSRTPPGSLEGMTREGSARQRSERAVAIDTAVDLCAPSITAVLDNVRELTMRTQATRFLLGLTGHCSVEYFIPAFPNKTFTRAGTSRT